MTTFVMTVTILYTLGCVLNLLVLAIDKEGTYGTLVTRALTAVVSGCMAVWGASLL